MLLTIPLQYSLFSFIKMPSRSFTRKKNLFQNCLLSLLLFISLEPSWPWSKHPSSWANILGSLASLFKNKKQNSLSSFLYKFHLQPISQCNTKITSSDSKYSLWHVWNRSDYSRGPKRYIESLTCGLHPGISHLVTCFSVVNVTAVWWTLFFSRKTIVLLFHKKYLYWGHRRITTVTALPLKLIWQLSLGNKNGLRVKY